MSRYISQKKPRSARQLGIIADELVQSGWALTAEKRQLVTDTMMKWVQVPPGEKPAPSYRDIARFATVITTIAKLEVDRLALLLAANNGDDAGGQVIDVQSWDTNKLAAISERFVSFVRSYDAEHGPGGGIPALSVNDDAVNAIDDDRGS